MCVDAEVVVTLEDELVVSEEGECWIDHGLIVCVCVCRESKVVYV